MRQQGADLPGLQDRKHPLEQQGKSQKRLRFLRRRAVLRDEDNGTLVLVEASPAGFSEKGRFSQPDRAKEKAWPHPTIANGKLYLRDQDLLLCYDVKAR